MVTPHNPPPCVSTPPMRQGGLLYLVRDHRPKFGVVSRTHCIKKNCTKQLWLEKHQHGTARKKTPKHTQRTRTKGHARTPKRTEKAHRIDAGLPEVREGHRCVYLEERGGDVLRLAHAENLPPTSAGQRRDGNTNNIPGRPVTRQDFTSTT